MDTSKIIIGSAQFGMGYGIANNYRKVSKNQVADILQVARKYQISLLDTAASYGVSEKIIGELASKDFRSITKLTKYDEKSNVSRYVRDCFLQSLERLQTDGCYGLLVHHPDDLLGVKGSCIYREMELLKKEGKVLKLGVSVYTPEQAIKLFDTYQFDILQFPVSLFDRRFLQNNLLRTLKTNNVELHARSIFLQGLLLMDLSRIPSYFNELKEKLILFDKEIFCAGLGRRKALIDFICSIQEIDHYIFGVDDATQLKDIISDFSTSHCSNIISTDKYECMNLNMINPHLWRVKSEKA